MLSARYFQERRCIKGTAKTHQWRIKAAILLMVLGKAVSEPMLHLLCNVNQHCFGGMFRELVGLTDVHLAASPAQTVQQEGLHLHVAHEVKDGSDLRFAIKDIRQCALYCLVDFGLRSYSSATFPDFCPHRNVTIAS